MPLAQADARSAMKFCSCSCRQTLKVFSHNATLIDDAGRYRITHVSWRPPFRNTRQTSKISNLQCKHFLMVQGGTGSPTEQRRWWQSCGEHWMRRCAQAAPPLRNHWPPQSRTWPSWPARCCPPYAHANCRSASQSVIYTLLQPPRADQISDADRQSQHQASHPNTHGESWRR